MRFTKEDDKNLRKLKALPLKLNSKQDIKGLFMLFYEKRTLEKGGDETENKKAVFKILNKLNKSYKNHNFKLGL